MHLNKIDKRKKKVPSRLKVLLVHPISPNITWNLDFMYDTLSNGKTICTLNIIDDFNREVFSIKIDTNFSSCIVIREFDELIGWRGNPVTIRSDNELEFIAKSNGRWFEGKGIEWLHIQSGRPLPKSGWQTSKNTLAMNNPKQTLAEWEHRIPPDIPAYFTRFATWQNHQLIFNRQNCLSFLQQKGKEQFGAHFTLSAADAPLIDKLLVYFIAAPHEAQMLRINLNKGILLNGPVGCGKTSLMLLMRSFLFPKLQFPVTPSRKIVHEFITKGYSVITKYSQSVNFNLPHNQIKTTGTWCFDDLGTESPAIHFGNTCNVMGEILLSRYENFITHGTKTHITTNLSATQIQDLYGTRIRSRLREMCNLISFPKSTTDKRT